MSVLKWHCALYCCLLFWLASENKVIVYFHYSNLLNYKMFVLLMDWFFFLLDKCRLFFKITQVRAGQKSLISVHLHFQNECMSVINSTISRGFISFYRTAFTFLLWRVKGWKLLNFHVDFLLPCPGRSLSWSICTNEDHKKEHSSQYRNKAAFPWSKLELWIFSRMICQWRMAFPRWQNKRS